MPKARDASDLSESVTKWITAASALSALLAGVLGGAATVSGGLDRMLREQLPLTLASGFFALLGLSLLGVAIVIYPDRARQLQRTRIFSIAALILFVLALGTGMLAAARSSSSEVQPGILAQVKTDGGLRLEGSIVVSGLRSTDRVNIQVHGYGPGSSPDPRPLLTTIVGGDRDGNLSLPLGIPLEGRPYEEVLITVWDAEIPRPDCNQLTRTLANPNEIHPQARAACAQLRLPPSR